ncbi:hypothetical protein DPMN_161820 [Dreissena polymorpha]|uniref:Uncharacterized protein n=1 Tax=Dreissena polymorpha TaxID=45954 RepID=A0A9D4ETQ2_DREPO|nr:hypothetical protein DPMN_161820 [Dreissena polymorpha]
MDYVAELYESLRAFKLVDAIKSKDRRIRLKKLKCTLSLMLEEGAGMLLFPLTQGAFPQILVEQWDLRFKSAVEEHPPETCDKSVQTRYDAFKDQV